MISLRSFTGQAQSLDIANDIAHAKAQEWLRATEPAMWRDNDHMPLMRLQPPVVLRDTDSPVAPCWVVVVQLWAYLREVEE